MTSSKILRNHTWLKHGEDIPAEDTNVVKNQLCSWCQYLPEKSNVVPKAIRNGYIAPNSNFQLKFIIFIFTFLLTLMSHKKDCNAHACALENKAELCLYSVFVNSFIYFWGYKCFSVEKHREWIACRCVPEGKTIVFSQAVSYLYENRYSILVSLYSTLNMSKYQIFVLVSSNVQIATFIREFASTKKKQSNYSF